MREKLQRHNEQESQKMAGFLALAVRASFHSHYVQNHYWTSLKFAHVYVQAKFKDGSGIAPRRTGQ